MGMRMTFTVFLLVVLATAVVSFTSARASGGRNTAARAFDRTSRRGGHVCCFVKECAEQHPQWCEGGLQTVAPPYLKRDMPPSA
nr:conotoxin precursor A [Conus ebraeus]